MTKTHLKVFNTCSCWPGWSGWLRWVPLKVGGIQGAKIIAITPPYFFSFPFIIPFVSCSLSFFSFSFLVLFSISNLTSFSVSTSLLFLYICIAPTLTLFHPLFMLPFFLYYIWWRGMNNQQMLHVSFHCCYFHLCLSCLYVFVSFSFICTSSTHRRKD